MNGAQRRKSGRKRFPWGVRLILSLVVLITLALIGVIVWLVKTQNLDQLSTRLGILASIMTILIGLPTLFFTVVKWPDAELPNEQAPSFPSDGSIHAEEIRATNVATVQHIGQQIIYSTVKEMQLKQGPATRGDEFDVFLCHNSKDKPEVKKIGEELRARGVIPWLDEWELRPGLPWQRALEAQIEHIRTAAMFVGKDGIGPWQHMELDAFLREFVSRGCPVIPVLLKDAPRQPQLPSFLGGMTWVDFRKQEPDPTGQLVWGITGKRPGSDGHVTRGRSDELRKAADAASKVTTLSSWKQRDLEERRDMLLEEQKILAERIRRVREAWRLETNEAIKMQQEHQFKRDEEALATINAELEKIEQALP